MTYTMNSATLSLSSRQTFGYGKAGQPLATIERHIYNLDTKAGECGEPVENNRYPLFSYYSIVTRLHNAPVCAKCMEVATA